MRFLLVAALIAVAVPAAGADPVRKYAVLSIIGDRFLVANSETRAGGASARDSYFDLPEGAMDLSATRAAVEAIARVEPSASAIVLRARAPALYVAQQTALDQNATSSEFFQAVRPALGDIAATHLILIAKLRDDAQIRFANYIVPTSARLEGIGFYVNTTHRVHSAATGEISRGYLALFAYFRVALFDLKSGGLLAEDLVRGSTSHAEPGKEPWDSMSAQDKVDALTLLVRTEVGRALPKVLKGP